jgi:hypothetical protein
MAEPIVFEGTMMLKHINNISKHTLSSRFPAETRLKLSMRAKIPSKRTAFDYMWVFLGQGWDNSHISESVESLRSIMTLHIVLKNVPINPCLASPFYVHAGDIVWSMPWL